MGDNHRGWKANVDFLLRPDSIAKVLEGSYDARHKDPRRGIAEHGRWDDPKTAADWMAMNVEAKP
jgi:hypothetical protein